MKIIKQILFVFLIMSFCACGQKNEKKIEEVKEVKEVEWTLLEESNYSIKYPSTWRLNQEKQMGTEFFILSELTGPNDNFSENVGLMIQDLTNKDIDLDYFIKISENQMKTMVTDFEPLVSERIKENKKAYHKLIYNGTQGIHRLTMEQYVWMVNEKAYVLTFTGVEDEYKNYKEIGEKILNSFLIKE